MTVSEKCSTMLLKILVSFVPNKWISRMACLRITFRLYDNKDLINHFF